MTTWSATGTPTTAYATAGVDDETVFDGGETVWDVDGNVARTRFDVTTSVTGWTGASSPATDWS